MPNQPKTVARTVRVDADVWATARIKALTTGETVSDVVRRALTEYTNAPTQAAPQTDHPVTTQIATWTGSSSLPQAGHAS